MSLEETIKKLERIAEKNPARPGFDTMTHVRYKSEETGTAVLSVINSNMPHLRNQGYYGEMLKYSYSIAGNEKGYTMSDPYLLSESRMHYGGITESGDEVRIHRTGTQRIWEDIDVEVGDIVLKKGEFRPYEK